MSRRLTFLFNQGLQLKHHLIPTGLLFATVDPSAPAFEEWFPASLLELLYKYNFRRLPHRRSIKYPGRFNWKTMVDGYQECLHCQYTHRSFSVKYPPTFYEVHNHHTYSRHIADPANPNDGLFLYFYPVCTLNLYGGGMSSFRVCPGDKVGDTRMEFDYYYDDGKGGVEGFEDYFKFVRKVAQEDFELCEVAQSNLERGIYSQGVLNQTKESGVLRKCSVLALSPYLYSRPLADNPRLPTIDQKNGRGQVQGRRSGEECLVACQQQGKCRIRRRWPGRCLGLSIGERTCGGLEIPGPLCAAVRTETNWWICV